MQTNIHGAINEDQRRFLYIAKGAAIFLMLYGHCIQYCVAGSELDFFSDGVFRTIYAFHMPLFMLISGYLFWFSFQKYTRREILTHRIQALVQPIVFCGMFSFLITDGVLAVAKGDFSGVMDGGWLQKLPSMWFLWSVLCATVAVTVVCKGVRSVSRQLPLLAGMVVLAAFFPNATENIFMYPYFIIGFYFARYQGRILPVIPWAKYLSLPLFPILMCFYERKHYIYITGLNCTGYSFVEMLGINAFRWLIGLIGSVFALTLLEILCGGGKNTGVVFRWLEKLGKKSLQIYALSLPLLSSLLSHGFPVLIRHMGGENLFAQNALIYDFGFTLPLAVGYAVILYGVVRLLEKTKISKLLFGR